MRKLLRTPLFSSLVLALTLGSALAQSNFNREREEIRKVVPLSSDGVFSLKNVNGGVTVAGWDQPNVEIHAIKTGPSKENLALVTIEIYNEAGRVAVNTIYPRGRNNLRVSVSYDVMVPKMARLRNVETVNGSVGIGGMASEVTAQTVNGSVKVRNSSGRVNASTVNGSVTAELERLDPEGDMKLETVNGSIKLYLPEGAAADIAAETTNGRLNTDFPLTVQGKFGPKRLHGLLGQGGPRIRMETVNGSVDLLRR